MPIINVDLLRGTTKEQKRVIADRITKSVITHCGSKPQFIHVVFKDVEANDWAVEGTLYADQNIGLAARD